MKGSGVKQSDIVAPIATTRFQSLKKIILQALDSISTNVIRKYFRRVREYHRAYREGKCGGQEVEKAVKLYNSHSPQHTQPQEIYNKFNKDSCSYKHCQYRYTCLGCGQHHPVTCCPTRPGGYSANFYSCEDSPRQPRCNQQRTGQRV